MTRLTVRSACILAGTCAILLWGPAVAGPPKNWDGLEYRKTKGPDAVYVRPGVQFQPNGLEALTKAGFSLLTPSRPGYGRTPLDVGGSSIQAAESFIALLDCLNIRTCSVIAVSGEGPTGIALAAQFPQRIERLVLMAAVSQPESRIHEPSYQQQMAFYGPLHWMQWSLLRLISNLSPRSMARQTMAIFSTHDPDDALSRLSAEGVEAIRRFYQGHSSRTGALNDATHTVGRELVQTISAPVLVVHSQEDKSVPFTHAR